METGGVDINCFPYKIIISTLKIGCKFGFLRSVRRSPIRFLKFTVQYSITWLLHIHCNSTSTKISEYFKLFAQPLQKLGGKKNQNWPKNVFFFKFPDKLLFGRASTVQKFFNDYISYTPFATQPRVRSLKIPYHSDHIGRSKRVKVPQKWTKKLWRCKSLHENSSLTNVHLISNSSYYYYC